MLPRYLWHVVRPAEGGLLAYVRDLLGTEERHDLRPVLVGPLSLSLPGVEEIRCRLVDGVDPLSDARTVIGLRRAAASRPPAIIHCHGAKAALLARLAFPVGPPLVYTVHCPPRRGVFDIGERLLAGRVSVFLAPSHVVRRELIQRWAVDSRRVRLAPVGLSSRRLQGMLALERAAPAGRTRIGVLARLVDDKGLDVLLAACRRLVDAGPVRSGRVPLPHVEVAGDGPLRGRLEAMAHALGIARWVRFLGPLPPDEAGPLLARWDIAVLPSRREAFGLAALEAMAAGCAVIISDAVGLAHAVKGDEDCLLFPSEDDAALAAALLDMLMRPDLVKRLSRHGREAAIRLPTIEDHASHLSTIYQEVTAAADMD